MHEELKCGGFIPRAVYLMIFKHLLVAWRSLVMAWQWALGNRLRLNPIAKLPSSMDDSFTRFDPVLVRSTQEMHAKRLSSFDIDISAPDRRFCNTTALFRNITPD